MTTHSPENPSFDIDAEKLTQLYANASAEGRHPTDEELVDAFGVDGLNALATSYEGMSATLNRFNAWYRAVLKPIGLPAGPAARMFTGQMTLVDYINTMSDDEADRFEQMYPELQVAYQARLDRKEAQLRNVNDEVRDSTR